MMTDIVQSQQSLELGRRAASMGDLTEARRWLRQAVEHAAEEAPIYISAIEELQSAGLQDDADDFLQIAIDKFPNNVWVARLLPMATWRKNDVDTALLQWKNLSLNFKDQCVVFHGYAEALRNAGKIDEAEQVAKQGIEADPNFVWIYDLYASIAELRGAWGEAEKRWRDLASRFPEHAKSYISLARIKEREGCLDQVVEILRAGVAALPNDSQIVCSLIANLIDQKDAEGTIETVRAHEGAAKRSDDYYHLVARAFILFADRPAAIELGEKLLNQPWIVDRQWLPALVGPFSIAIKTGDEKINQAEVTLLHLIDQNKINTKIRDFVMLWLFPETVSKQTRENFLMQCIHDGQIGVLLALSQDKVQNGRDLSRYGIRDTIINLVQNINIADMQGHSEGAAFALMVLAFRFAPELSRQLLDSKFSSFSSIVDRWFRVVPSLSTGPALIRKKLRIAVCVSGQLRGYKDAFPTWGHLGLDMHDVDYFVHVWKGIGRKFPVSQSNHAQSPNLLAAYNAATSGYDVALLRSWYPAFFDQGTVCEDELYEFYKACKVVVEDDMLPQFANMRNDEKMHYKIYSCNELARHQSDYDLVIRLRPDKSVIDARVDWIEIFAESGKHKVIFADRGKIADGHFNLLIGDQFAFGHRHLMNVYASAYKFQPLSWEVRRPLFAPSHQAHVSLALTCFYHGVDVQEASGVQFGALLDAAGRDPISLLQALERDIGGVSRNHVDEMLLRAARADVSAV